MAAPKVVVVIVAYWTFLYLCQLPKVVTFSVNPTAKRCTEALPTVTMKERINSRLGYKVESCYNHSDPVVHSGFEGDGVNTLIKAVHTAFDRHYPLVLVQ